MIIEPKDILVLQIKYGGLGDHLFYSHIPKIAKQTKEYKYVYISNFSEYRHPDYKKIIWELNPYVDGFVDEKGQYPEIIELAENENLLDRIMIELGMDDHKRFHEPELYYTPKVLAEYKNINVFDPNFVSYVGTIEYGDKSITKWFKTNDIKINYQMKLRERNLRIVNFNRFIDTPSLEDFCNLIVSCNKLYCLTSGTATLAAALGKNVVAFYAEGQNLMFHHSKLHRYIKIESYQFSFYEKQIRTLKDMMLAVLKKMRHNFLTQSQNTN